MQADTVYWSAPPLLYQLPTGIIVRLIGEQLDESEE